MELDIKVAPVYEKNWIAEHKEKFRVIANEGGARSAKTYSILNLLITDAYLEEEPCVYTIARKRFKTLKGTAYRDFLSIIRNLGIYNKAKHNKTDYTYYVGNVMFEFVGLDDPQKSRGAKRKKLFVNEANDLDIEDWRQLVMRTEGTVFIDYNPSDEFHWIYDEVLTRDDCKTIKSTFMDNPFLEPRIKAELLRLKDVDPEYWNVYGLGNRAVSRNRIYSHWKIGEFPEGRTPDVVIGGVDFGFNHPNVFIRVRLLDGVAYIDEIVYQSRLQNGEFIDLAKDVWDKRWTIYGDKARPEYIKEWQDAGYDMLPADKEVLKGIDTVKSVPIIISAEAVNTIKEIKKYSWKQKNGKNTDEPVKFEDDAMDAIRYAIHTYLSQFQKAAVEDDGGDIDGPSNLTAGYLNKVW